MTCAILLASTISVSDSGHPSGCRPVEKGDVFYHRERNAHFVAATRDEGDASWICDHLPGWSFTGRADWVIDDE